MNAWGKDAMVLHNPSKSFGIRRKIPDLTVEECLEFCRLFEEKFIRETPHYEQLCRRLLDESLKEGPDKPGDEI